MSWLRTRLRAIGISVFAGALVTGGIAGYLVSGASSSDHVSATGSSSLRPGTAASTLPPAGAAALARCATASRAELSAASLSGFKTAVSGLVRSPLVRVAPATVIPARYRPAAYNDFVLGRLTGLVTAEAYSPAYLRQSQAYQKKMGYRVTDTPELPLQGQIVSANPARILEAYQLNTVYTSPAGAESFQKVETPHGKVPGLTTITLPGALAPDPAYMADNGSGQETGYYVNLVVDGFIQVDFNFRGGPDVPLSALSRLVTLGIGDLNSACNLR